VRRRSRSSPHTSWSQAPPSRPSDESKLRSLLLLLAIATPAHARPIHGSIGGGGAIVIAGEDGDHFRNELSLDLKWRSRYGAILGWRAFDYGSFGDGEHKGLLTGGLVYEAGAARPRLVLDLTLEAGADLDQEAPLVGGGIRNTLTIYGPLGVVGHLGAYLVIDGVDDSRLHLQSNLLVVLRW
jgi:hypothetical protein